MIKKYVRLKLYIYKPMVMYNASFVKTNWNDNLKIPKDKLLTLYILLMHLIEYYFYVNWNIVIEVWNISY